MKSISLLIDNNPKIVQVERYFSSHGNAYLIYSENDRDQDGNVKIFVAKIEDNNKVVAIESDEEWTQVKKDIVEIVNDNKECTKLDVEDLDFSLLNNLEITSVKALRLPSAVMPYLSANQPQFSYINLETQEQKLDDKTQKLKDINEDLTNLMGEVERQVTNTVKEEPSVDINHEDDKLSATMEIIMPSQSEVVKEPEKKEKFSIKNLFGKKKHEEKHEEEKSLEIESPTNDPVESVNDVQIPTIVEETNLPQPTELEPIPVANQNVLESKIGYLEKPSIQIPMDSNNVTDNSIINEIAPSIDVVNLENHFENPNMEQDSMSSNEIEPSITPVGFDFFDSIPVAENISNESMNDTISNIEILNIDEDDYKEEYKKLQRKNEELENKIAIMEKELENYQRKLSEVKNIVE